MEGLRYRMIVTGKAINGVDAKEVVDRLTNLFKQPRDSMARLFGNKPIAIKTLELLPKKQTV